MRERILLRAVEASRMGMKVNSTANTAMVRSENEMEKFWPNVASMWSTAMAIPSAARPMTAYTAISR